MACSATQRSLIVVLGVVGILSSTVETADAMDGDHFWLELSRVHRQLVFDCEVDIWTDALADEKLTVWIYLKTRRTGTQVAAVHTIRADPSRRLPQYPIQLFAQERLRGLGWERRLDFALRLGPRGVPISFEVTERSRYAGEEHISQVACAGHPRALNQRERVD